MLTFARESQHDAPYQFHNGLHNISMSVTSEYNCAIFCRDGHPPKFVYPAPRCKFRILSTIRGVRSVGGQCRIIVSAPFWLKSVVKFSVFAVGFGTCPWCSSLSAVLFLPWWRVPVVSARPQLDSGVGAKFLTSMNCLERRFLAKAEERGLLHLVLRERRSRALVRMHARRSSE